MFLCNLLMPSIMVIAGYCMYKNPPKEINGLIGYRTAMSEKNKDTWAVAHACMRQTDTRHVNAPASTGSQRLTVLLPERNAHTI